MVSGFFTSPWDHSRILSGDARLIRMALNESGSFGFSKKLKMSFTVSPAFWSAESELRVALHLIGFLSALRGQVRVAVVGVAAVDLRADAPGVVAVVFDLRIRV